MTQQIDTLRQEITQARERYEENCQRHLSDIKVIGDFMRDEAESRNMTDLYDVLRRDLNQELHVKLPEARKNYVVTLTLLTSVDEAPDVFQALQHNNTVTISGSYYSPEKGCMMGATHDFAVHTCEATIEE